MDAIQVWLPTVGRSLGDPRVMADLQRACEPWRNETWVYTVPGLPELVRQWPTPFGTAMAVRADLTESFAVFHVGANGMIYGRRQEVVFATDEAGTREAFTEITALPERPAQELLDAWLNLPHGNDLHVCKKVREWMGALQVPMFDDAGKVTGYEVHQFARGAGPSYALVPDGDGALQWRIPTGPDCAPSVFPDAESMLRDYGSPDGGRRRPSAAGFKGKPDQVDIRIGGPLAFLFPIWVGLDVQFNLIKMLAMMRIADPMSALAESRRHAARYLSQGTSTWELTWFWPTVAQLGLQPTLWNAAAQFRLPAVRTLNQASKSPQWRNKMAEPVPVTRAYGPIGLFWALLLDRLSQGRVHEVCAACGRVLPVARGKRRRFCTKDEAIECFKRRQREQRRQSRGRKHAVENAGFASVRNCKGEI